MKHTRMMMMTMLPTTALIIALIAGCSLWQPSFSGTASKGPIAGATVTVYRLESDGSRGTELGAAVTDSDGTYVVSVSSAAGPIEVVVTGGSYEDEATGATVEVGAEELRVMLGSVASGAEVAVTALTTIAAGYAAEQASGGLAAAIENANKAVAEAFGLGAGFDITAVQPADLTAGGSKDDEGRYGAVLAGLSTVANEHGLAASQVLNLIAAMAKDFEDGSFDGTDAAGIALDTALMITPEAAMQGLEAAINSFLDDSRNRSSITRGDISFTFPALP